jgi:hypothetical protein
MLASVHVADVGARGALAFGVKTPKPAEVDGLRHANVAFGASLSASTLPPREVGRVGLVAFWDDDAALDRFLDSHPAAEVLAGGWRVRLDPLRAFGSWPGLAPDIPTARSTQYDGPAAVLTLGRVRMTQLPRFLRTSAVAEGRVLEAPGMIWATGLARPPFVATCSLWESTKALSTYAFGRAEPAHADAIAEQEKKDFHHQSAFIRFRPYRSEGSLDGTNPLPAGWMPAPDPA